MKPFKKLITFLLIPTILISSGGVVLAVHYCSSLSDKSVSLFEEGTCCSGDSKSCGKENSLESFENNCCDVKLTYHKVDVTSFISEHHFTDYLFYSNNLNPKFDSAIISEDVFYTTSNKAPPFFIGGKTFLYISLRLLI